MSSFVDNEIMHLLKAEATREKAFTLLLKTYKEQVYFIIRRMVLTHADADDLVQETFIKAWKKLSSFRGESSLKTWLYRIATNEALMHLRKKKNLARFSFVKFDEALLNGLKADTYFDGDKTEIALQRALLTLPEKQRLIFNLRYFQALSFSEIAEITDTSVGGLKANYHHAKQKIEKQLNQVS